MGIDINYQPDMFQVGQLAYNSASQQAANKMQLYRDQNAQRIQEKNLQRVYELQDRDAQMQADWLNDSITVAEKTANDLRAVYNPNNLTEPGRVTWAELQGKLKAVQKQRAFLTPQAYAQLMGKWIGDVEMSGMDNHVIKVPTVDEDFASNAIDADTGAPVDWKKPPKRMFIRRKDAKGNVVFDLHDLNEKPSAAGGVKVDPVKDEKQARDNLKERLEDEANAQKAKDKAEFEAKKQAQENFLKNTSWIKIDGAGPHPGIEEQEFDESKYAARAPTQDEVDEELRRLQGLRGSAQVKSQQPQQAPASQGPVSGGVSAPAGPNESIIGADPNPATPAAAAPKAPPIPLPFPATEQQMTEIQPAEGEVKVGNKVYPLAGTVYDPSGEQLQVFPYEVAGVPLPAVANPNGTISVLEKGKDGRWHKTKQITDPDITPTEDKPVTVHDVMSALPQGDKDADLVRELLTIMGSEGVDAESWTPEAKKTLEKLGGVNGAVWQTAGGLASYLSSGARPIRFFKHMTEEDMSPGGVYSGVVGPDGKSYTAVWDGNQFIPLSQE